MWKLLLVKLSWLLVIPVFCSVATAATDMTVFGIPLGAKFNIPECKKTKYGRFVVYTPLGNNVCFERTFDKIRESGEIVNDTVLIKFPFSDTPRIITGDKIVGQILEGNLEGIGFNTAGVSTAEMVLEKLKEKYGTPTALVPKKVQNRFGSTFDAFDAVWNLEDLFVSFQSVTDSLDSGLVNIDTKKGKEYRDKNLKELLKDKRPL